MGIILHCDMNNYFVSVELVDKPQLSALPVAVCGDPAQRHGIVSVSYTHLPVNFSGAECGKLP